MEKQANPKGDPWAASKGWDSCLRSRMEADKRALEDQELEEDVVE